MPPDPADHDWRRDDMGRMDPDAVAARFGLAALEFGRSVPPRERAAFAARLAAAFGRLTLVLGWPRHALGLGKTLTVSFGTITGGGGRRRAGTYILDSATIHLRRTLPVTMLAHEWWHALDHHLGPPLAVHDAQDTTCAGSSGRDRSVATIIETHATDTALVDDPPPWNALGALIDDLEKGDAASRAAARTDLGDYWTRPTEIAARSFERYVAASLARRGIRDDVLCGVAERSTWMARDPEKNLPHLDPCEWPEETRRHERRWRLALEAIGRTLPRSITPGRRSPTGGEPQRV